MLLKYHVTNLKETRNRAMDSQVSMVAPTVYILNKAFAINTNPLVVLRATEMQSNHVILYL